MTVKLIDPLGRIARLNADVPSLPALPPPELGPVRFARMVGPLFSPPPRLAGTQLYFIFTRIVRPLEVSVTLVDPLGRSVTQTGTLP